MHINLFPVGIVLPVLTATVLYWQNVICIITTDWLYACVWTKCIHPVWSCNTQAITPLFLLKEIFCLIINYCHKRLSYYWGLVKLWIIALLFFFAQVNCLKKKKEIRIINSEVLKILTKHVFYFYKGFLFW